VAKERFQNLKPEKGGRLNHQMPLQEKRPARGLRQKNTTQGGTSLCLSSLRIRKEGVAGNQKKEAQTSHPPEKEEEKSQARRR